MRVLSVSAAVLVSLCLLPPAPARAQNAAAAYPDKPVRLVVPFTPGASTDIVARLLGGKLTEAWGQQIVVDNRPGAGGALGGEVVARAVPDGYTLMITNPGPSLNNIVLRKQPPYRFEDFSTVIFIAAAPLIAVANPKFPPNSMSELIQYAKTNPGKVNWGSSGTGSNPHAALELLKSVTRVDITHVPYKGSGPALTDTVAGQIHGLYTTVATAEAMIRTGRAKVLGVAGPRRQDVIPNVPTLAEQGIKGADNTLWIGMVTTAKVPRAIVEKVNREVNRILRTPEVSQRFAQLGLDIEGGTPAHFGAFIQGEAKKLSGLVRSGAINIQ